MHRQPLLFDVEQPQNISLQAKTALYTPPVEKQCLIKNVLSKMSYQIIKVGNANNSPEIPFNTILLFNSCTISHNGRQIFYGNRLLERVIYLTTHNDIMYAPKRDIDRPSIYQPSVVGVNDRFNNFVFEVHFLASILIYS